MNNNIAKWKFALLSKNFIIHVIVRKIKVNNKIQSTRNELIKVGKNFGQFFSSIIEPFEK